MNPRAARQASGMTRNEIAISRDGGRAQWLTDGGEPDRGGFLVVRREDRV